MEDRGRPFAALVLETLTRRSAELGQRWAGRARLLVPELVRVLLDAASGDDEVDTRGDGSGDGRGGGHRADPVTRAGWAIGGAAHRRNAPLHQLLDEVDHLTAELLRAAEHAAAEHGDGTARDGLALAQRLAGATSLLRLGLTSGYLQAVEDQLRERYRAIRHDLRNPLGTLESAVALLTDESVPPETRQNSRVRTMVVRNARVLDQMIGQALSDDAAHLKAFETPRQSPVAAFADTPAAARRPTSGREQRDDVARARQRPDLEPGAL